MGDFTTPMQPAGAMGGMGSTQGIGPDYGTLDEPVTETIMRDVRMVGNKMICVLNPRKANIQTLKDWDLWGPLLLCLMLATLLSWFAPTDQKSLVFASVFVIIWVGAAVVTVNALLLGGNISFFQVRAAQLHACSPPGRCSPLQDGMPRDGVIPLAPTTTCHPPLPPTHPMTARLLPHPIARSPSAFLATAYSL